MLYLYFQSVPVLNPESFCVRNSLSLSAAPDLPSQPLKPYSLDHLSHTSPSVWSHSYTHVPICPLFTACPANLNKKCFVFRLIPESPRWLLQKGRMQEAEQIIRECAKKNGVSAPEVLFRADDLSELMVFAIFGFNTLYSKTYFTVRTCSNQCDCSVSFHALDFHFRKMLGKKQRHTPIWIWYVPTTWGT